MIYYNYKLSLLAKISGIICDQFLEISLNVTFCNSNIYNQNEEWQLPINLKVVTICSSHLELPENNWKYFERCCGHNKLCNSMYFNVQDSKKKKKEKIV